MANVITYGTFDFFHEGHKRILERAKALCGPTGCLYVGVTSENYDRERGKLNVNQSLSERMDSVRASGYADEVFVEEYEGQKIEDLQRYHIDKFVIGDDWLGKYDYLNEWCSVVYLPRTKGVSSTMIRNSASRVLRGGIVGCGRIANRFIVESRFVSGIIFDAVYNPNLSLAEDFAQRHSLTAAFDNLDDFLTKVDVVYVATPHKFHYEYVRDALAARKHVLCEKPITLDDREAEELYAMAQENGVILQEALKTAFAPGFRRLVNLAKGGVVGKIKQVSATFTRLTFDKTLREYDPAQGGGALTEFGSYVLCPIIKLLGSPNPDNVDVHKLQGVDERVETFVTGMLKYTDATGLFTVGLTGKSEGQLLIAGTTGYIHVPSPWWKTEYFEIRDDYGLAKRRVFCPFVGDGLRYELAEFVNSIVSGSAPSSWRGTESIALLKTLLYMRGK